MMPLINEVMLAVSGSLAASIVAKATLIMALALIGARLAHRSRAALRHALLAAAFGVLPALPIASVVAPPVRIVVAAAAPEQALPSLVGVTSAIPPAAPTQASVASAVPQSAGLSLSALLLAGWIAGMALFLLPVLMGLWQVRRLRQSALPWPQGQPVVERLARNAGIHRRIEVLLHDTLPGPMTCGLAHPALVLPRDAQTWDGEDLNRAMVHELEHVRRGDWATHCFARAICAAYWFHPLVWIAWRQLALEAERSCDDAVLSRSEATAYADQLVGLARRLSSKTPLLAMANRADLTARVGALLDGQQRRGRAGALAVALACACAAALVLAISPLTVVAAQQSASMEVNAAPVPQFAARTGLVIETILASDKEGKTVEGLSAKDFALTEDGAPQTISVFEFQKLDAEPQATQGSISSYYILGYYPTNQDIDGIFRKIKITSKDDRIAKLDYRSGYYAMKSFTRFGATGPGVADHTVAPDSNFPVLLHKVAPEYSLEARKAKFQGTVNLSVEINAAGQVTNARVLRSLGLGLDQKAIDAVKQWRFKPSVKDGKPVAAQADVQVDFRLL